MVGFAGAGGLEEMFGPTFRGAAYPDVAGLAAEVARLQEPTARAALGHEQRRRFEERWSAAVAAPALWRHLEAAAGEAS